MLRIVEDAPENAKSLYKQSIMRRGPSLWLLTVSRFCLVTGKLQRSQRNGDGSRLEQKEPGQNLRAKSVAVISSAVPSRFARPQEDSGTPNSSRHQRAHKPEDSAATPAPVRVDISGRSDKPEDSAAPTQVNISGKRSRFWGLYGASAKQANHSDQAVAIATRPSHPDVVSQPAREPGTRKRLHLRPDSCSLRAGPPTSPCSLPREAGRNNSYKSFSRL